MTNKPSKKHPKKPQSELFKEAAKSLGCDESKESFEKKLSSLVSKKGKNKDTRHRPK